jgi:hypothetical protein
LQIRVNVADDEISQIVLRRKRIIVQARVPGR